MANFYVAHHKFPSNPQFFTASIRKVAGFRPEQNPNFKPKYAIAEPFWKVFIYTTGIDSSGNAVGPIITDVVGSEDTVTALMETKLAELCDLIDWSQQGEFTPQVDSAAPVIVEQFPTVGQAVVPINSPVVLRVQDLLPAVGIDSSTVLMSIGGLSVTPNVVGNKYDYTFSFSPRPIFDS